jgi:LPLT family lysophospholipid transporter-like MFS transporter
MGLSAFGAITAFGIVVAGFMWVIQRWHKSNTVKYKEQVDHLLNIARSDKSH